MGSTSVRAVFNKDLFNVGETAHVECFVDNTNCSETIKYLEIKLRRLIHSSVRDIDKDDTIF